MKSAFRFAAAALALAVSACASPPDQAPAGPSFAPPLRLVGTEPFWGGRIGADAITLSGAERPDVTLPAVAAAVAGTSARFVTPAEGSAVSAPSTVVVTATLAGASEAAMADVARTLENALTAVDGVHRVRAATTPGRSVLTVGFMPGRTPEAAAAAARTAIGRARLPARAGAEVTFARPQPVDITLVAETCSDGMSDKRYPFSATVQFAGETLRGCAIPEAEWGGEA
jgi:uncharacterized membrane protein